MLLVDAKLKGLAAGRAAACSCAGNDGDDDDDDDAGNAGATRVGDRLEPEGAIGTGGVKNDEATWLGWLMMSNLPGCSMAEPLAGLAPCFCWLGRPNVWLPRLVAPPAPDEA